MLRKRLGYILLVLIGITGLALLLFFKFRPNPAMDSYTRGKSLMQINMDNEAGDLFLQAIQRDPKFAPPYEALAQLALKINAYPLSAKYWQKYIDHAPDAKEAYSQLAYTQMMMGQEANAFKSADEEIKRNPASAQAHLTLGILNARKSAAKPALEHLEIAAKSYQDAPKVQLAYAKVLALTGNLDKANEVLQLITRTEKSFAEPYYWLGYVAMRRVETPETLKEAGKYLKTSLDLQPLFPQANLETARLYLRLKRYPEALNFANRALQNRKHYPIGLSVKAKVLEAMGRAAEAKQAQEEFSKEAQLAARTRALLRQYSADPQNLQILLPLAETQLELEQPQAAYTFLQNAAERTPNDPRIQNILRRAEAMAKKQNQSGSRQEMQFSLGEEMEEKQ